MTQTITTWAMGTVIQRGLLACGLLLGLTGCPDDDHSASLGSPTLSASLIQQAYAKATNTETGDDFGYAVALNGDTLVVGAYMESSNETGVGGTGANNSALNSGAVYVFTRSGGVWSHQAYLKASNTEANDNFGTAVALDGDTLVVGAPYEASNETGVGGTGANNSAAASGAAYVFTRTAGVWSQQAYVKASNTEAGDRFGSAVAVAGDTLAVGALQESSNETGVGGTGANNSALNSGAVYVFTRTAGVWSQQAYVKASNTEAGDTFGKSVALTGDTLAVGASQEDSNETGVGGTGANNSAANSGAVYVFTRSAGVWSQQAYVKASNTEANDQFGYALALDGETLVAGATGEDSNATGIGGTQGNNSASDSGAVYVFTRSGGVWSQQAYVKASNTEANDVFGQSVAVSGDTLVVGAPYEASNATGIGGTQGDNNAFGSGAVYVFTRSGGVWSQRAYVKASNTDAFDEFGNAVAVDGTTLAVGAHLESSNATGVNGNQTNNSAGSSGAVYVLQ